VGGNVVPELSHGSPGRRVMRGWRRPAGAAYEHLRDVPTSVIGDAMNRLGVMCGEIQRVSGGSFIGTALTVWVRSGDNSMIHLALESAEPGDVLVVNGQSSLAHGLFGDLMARRAIAAGVVGLVVDGAVRDRMALIELGFPTYALGVCAAGPAKEGAGEVGSPIACGRVAVHSGDVVVGDGDGVVVVPQSDLAVVTRNVASILDWELAQRDASELNRGG